MSIEVHSLSKQYGEQKAVDDISFQVRKGEILGFLGPNGAGKSTTLKILTGFIPQTTGTAKICGIDTREDMLEVRRKVGYLPEHNPLYTDMYVREFLSFSARLYPDKKITDKRIREVIDRVGLTREKGKKLSQLSKGYRQRAGLAQAILHDPEVLILDEPTTGFDPNQLTEVRGLIRELGKEKTVIFSSHIMQEVEAVAQRVVIIDRGKLVADDAIGQLGYRMDKKLLLTVAFKENVSAATLQQIHGIQKAEPLGDGRWRLYAAAGPADVREDIFAFAVSRKLTLLEMTREEQSLEDVFKQLTR